VVEDYREEINVLNRHTYTGTRIAQYIQWTMGRTSEESWFHCQRGQIAQARSGPHPASYQCLGNKAAGAWSGTLTTTWCWS